MANINLILKLFLIFIVLYCLFKIIPKNNIRNSDLILLLFINILVYYILSNLL
jgi:hypothetical protein